ALLSLCEYVYVSSVCSALCVVALRLCNDLSCFFFNLSATTEIYTLSLHDALPICLRPMTPDSTPIIGVTRFKNLFLNTGHGTLGWTMACGSGKLISDIVLNHKTEISTEGLSLGRYSHAA